MVSGAAPSTHKPLLAAGTEPGHTAPVSASHHATPSVVGTSPRRRDGVAKVKGETRFVADMDCPGAWCGRALRAPLARARVVSIDSSAALAADPEIVVLTAADLPGPNVLAVIEDDWPVLAGEFVNHATEPVALVAAPTAERARAALEALVVDYEELPAILDLKAALAAEEAGEPVSVLASCGLGHEGVEAAFASAPVIVDGVYWTGHQEHLYIEPQGVLALPPNHSSDGSLEVVGSLQCPFYVHKALTHLLGLEGDQVRVRQAPTGGGFGGKEDYPDMVAAHAALLALAVGQPVRVIYERTEDMEATTRRHPARVTHRTAVAEDGKLLAQDIEVVFDGGAYVTLSPVVLSRGVLHAGGPYACPAVRIRGRAMATATPPNGAFRGFGAPQVQFAGERQMDRIARRLGLDPLTVRERNAYVIGDTTPTGQVLTSSVAARECLAEAERRTDFRRRWREAEAARTAGRPDDGEPLPGLGLALGWHGSGFTGNGERRMRSPVRLRLVLDDEGAPQVQVRVSSTDFGQGTGTVLAQIVADACGAPFASVCVINPDTGEVPDSGPTVASRTVMVVGGALDAAGRELAIKLGGGDFMETAASWLAQHGALEIETRHEPDPETSFDEDTYSGTAYPAYGWTCAVVEAELDPDTLETRPRRLTTVTDVGRVINPLFCKGQVEGGTLQALGYGYLEEMTMEAGRPLQNSFATYIVPTAADAPEMDTVLLEHPAPAGPGGAKGVGELPMNAGAAAVVGAMENATGIVSSRAPTTPEVLFEAGIVQGLIRDEGVGGGVA
ncbi:MAG: aldehyde oxidase [Planctomycetes bacterium]|nr:aldehyde oxidase [Planctomycetota bacterium]